MAKQAVATRTDLDPIDRLEEKVRMLVGIVTQLRADHARVTEENGRLAREIENLRTRLAESEAHGSELSALRIAGVSGSFARAAASTSCAGP